MGDERQRRHHAAMDDLVLLLSKANQDLSSVRRHLDDEFRRSFPDNVNPMKLVERIKKIQEEIAKLKELCRQLLAEKQDLIDKARLSMVMQKSALQRLLASSGLPPMDESENAAYTNLDQVIDEWTLHVRTKAGEVEYADEDINQMLFSAVVPNN